jgi:RHS repeat-associated protein
LGNIREVWQAAGYFPSETIQRTQYYPSGLPWASNYLDSPSTQPNKYNGKQFDEMHGYDTYDYGARGYYAAMGRFTTLDPMAEKYYSISPYAYCAGNPLKYTDPTGMLYGDYYNEDIKKIGTDGNKDGKKYIVIDKNEANKIKKTDKAGGTTQRSDVKSAILKPSQDVMTASNKAIQNTDNTRNEYGFVAATDGSTSTIQTNNDPGSVQLGPGYQELEGQGKQTSFDVHIHPDKATINTNGTFTADDPNPSGTPGQQGDDFGYRTMKENNGQVSEPSWVIGTQTTVTNNNDVINKYQIRVVTFYKSTGIVGQMDWTKFQNIVNKIP